MVPDYTAVITQVIIHQAISNREKRKEESCTCRMLVQEVDLNTEPRHAHSSIHESKLWTIPVIFEHDSERNTMVTLKTESA